METNKFTFIDLFSGIGGFRIALENNGGECLHFSEISKDAIEAYCKNSNEPIEKLLKLNNIISRPAWARRSPRARPRPSLDS